MSVGCGSPSSNGTRTPCQFKISKPGRRPRTFAAAAVTPENKASKKRPNHRGRGNYFLLTAKTL